MFGSTGCGVRQAMLVALIVILMFKQSSELGAQENWSRFHGPNGSGLALDSKLPSKITPEDVRWKARLAGVGSSSPVIWGDRVFITSCDLRTGLLTVQCFNVASGEQVWSKEFQQKVYRLHGRNNFASSTPAVDADHVYFTFADPDQTVLMALDHDGNEKWKRDFGTWVSQHGFGVSPMVYQDKVIFFNSQLAAGGETGKSRVIAVGCKDGSDVWTSPLKATKSCYAVPSVFRSADGKEQLVSCNTGDGFFSLDPETGKMNWSTLPFKMRTVASTLVADGMIIGSNGSGGGGNYLVAIKPDQNDSSAEPVKAYEVKRANYVPSPVAVDGRLFLFSDKGIAQCVDLQTGKLFWQKRMARGFSGSPVSTAEHIYILDEGGKLFVIDAKPEYNEVCTLELGESSRSTPAIAGDRLFLRTDSQLICIGKK